MIRKSMPSGLTRGWAPVFPRDKREAFARRSCSNKEMRSLFDSTQSDHDLRVPVAKMPRGPQMKPRWAQSPTFDIRVPVKETSRMRDPYEVLGVPRGASAAAIKSAYRKLAKKHHPDANKNDPKSAARFSELNSANEIIGDEDKRKQFDRGEIDAEGKPRFQGFPGGGDPRGRGASPGGFETHTFRSGGAGPGGFGGGGGFEDILN